MNEQEFDEALALLCLDKEKYSAILWSDEGDYFRFDLQTNDDVFYSIDLMKDYL